jgi:hypothetical protein
VAYDDEVLTTGPVAFWLPEAAAVVDRVGARDASYVRAPTLSPGLTGAGTSLNCGGTVFAERAHDPALKPAVGTIMAWVRPATVDDHWPLGADAKGLNPGDFALRLGGKPAPAPPPRPGVAGAYFQDTSATHLLLTELPYYGVGQVMCMVVTFDGSGFTVHLDGHAVKSSAAYTSGLSGNLAPWTLGADRPEDGTIFTGEIDRVAIWDRVLSRNEIYLVSLLEPPP